MGNKFEAMHAEFNMFPKDMRNFKKFVETLPETASYKLENRDGSIFFDAYWIQVNPDPQPKQIQIYTVNMPHICVYGKLAYELITDLNPMDGIPFHLKASDTIDLSRGFVDIMIRKIKNCQAPYIVVEGWVKEHLAILEEATEKYRMVVQFAESNILL